MTNQTQMNKGFLRPAEACSYLSMGRTQLHNLHETDETFPRKIRLGRRCVGWTKAQLDEWLDLKTQEASQ